MTNSAGDQVLQQERDGAVVTLTIDRPQARNAVSPEVAEQIEAALDRFEDDDSAWVAILTGAGSAFCAGADLKAVARGDAARLSTRRGGFGGFVLRERRKPIIAAVNGPAHAGGCELMLACDLAVMADHATLAVPEVKRSLVAAAGALWRLPHTIGEKRAAELLLTGDSISAAEALELGLVNRVVPGDQVMSEARALAKRIAVNAPLAVQASRVALSQAFDHDQQELSRISGRAIASVFGTEDFAEGPRAFIEKRDPVWKGK